MNTLVRTHRLEGTIEARAPFDFEKTVRFVSEFRPTGGEQRVARSTIVKTFGIGGRAIRFEIWSTGSVEAPRVAYALDANEPINDAAHEACRDRLRFWLSLEDELAPFYALASTDPPFARLIDDAYGLHQPKFPTPFENAAHALLSQRTPLAVTKKRRAALIERYGAAMTFEGELLRAFPSPSRLAAAGAAEIGATIGHRVAGERIARAAAAFAGVDESWLREAAEDDVADWLRALPGFGAWSTTFVLVRGLGRMAAMREATPELLTAGRAVYGTSFDRVAANAKLRAYGDYAGLWAFTVRATPVVRA